MLLCSTFPTRENFNSVFNPILYFSFSHMIECSRRGWIPAFQNSFSSPLFRQLLPVSGEFIFLLLLVVVLNPCVHACVCTMNTYYCQHVRTKGQPQVLTVILHLVSWCLMLPTPHASRLSCFQGSSCLCFPSLCRRAWHYRHRHHLQPYVGSGDPNIGPYACMGSVIPTEPSLQSQELTLILLWPVSLLGGCASQQSV